MLKLFFLLLLSWGYNEPSKLVKEGDTYYNKFDNFNAVKKYQEAYDQNPNDFETLMKLVRTYSDCGEELIEMRKRDQAEPWINKAIHYAEIFQKKYPNRAEPYTYLALSYGNIAMFKGNKEKVTYAQKVESNAKKAIKLDPNQFTPYIIMGIYNREAASLNWFLKAFANTFFGKLPEGSFEESERMLNKALSIDPDLMIAVYNLSKTYKNWEKEDLEKKMLKKVLTMRTRDYRDKYTKAKAERRLKELEA